MFFRACCAIIFYLGPIPKLQAFSCDTDAKSDTSTRHLEFATLQSSAISVLSLPTATKTKSDHSSAKCSCQKGPSRTVPELTMLARPTNQSFERLL